MTVRVRGTHPAALGHGVEQPELQDAGAVNGAPLPAKLMIILMIHSPRACNGVPGVVRQTGVLATSKNRTQWKPRGQVLDGGLVSSLRALL